MAKVHRHTAVAAEKRENDPAEILARSGQTQLSPAPAQAHKFQRPSVLFVGNFFSSQGRNPGVCEDLAKYLSLRDWPIRRTSTHTGRARRLLDIAHTIWSKRRFYDIAQVDVFSGRAFFLAEVSCNLLRLLNKPYILTLHGGNLPVFAKRWPGRMRRLLHSAAVVTAPSAYLIDQFRSHGKKINLIPNSLDLHVYPFKHRVKVRPQFIWLRAMHATYNPPLAVRTIASLAKTYPDIHLSMIGPDKGDGSLPLARKLARELGIEKHIQFSGAIHREEVAGYLNEGDIFLNTTNIDNTPVSVLEAMACGLCVVSTNVGGISWLLENEVDALLTPAGDVAAMTKAARRILDEPELANRLSMQARRKAERFDWSNIVPKWENLFIGLTKGRH